MYVKCSYVFNDGFLYYLKRSSQKKKTTKKNDSCITNGCITFFASAFIKIHYKVDMGGGTAIAGTPEMERVKRNQENISTVHCGVTLPQPFPPHQIPLLLVIDK